MCGIAGILHFDRNRHVDKLTLKRMCDIIKYRGPDGEGFFTNNNVGLGHRRLSIIDLSTGDQPMLSDDGKKIIIFNGEIYNYIELRDELKTLGYQFKTNSDTEVIIKAYEQWGNACQEKLNGMWAFAIWDELKQELFISRDRLGEKPLHYAVTDNSIVFGSEMKSLFEYGIKKEPRLELLELYLVFTHIPAPNTFYKNIFKLMPGHCLIVKDGNFKEIKYWDLPKIDEQNMITDKKAVYENFEQLFYDSIKIRMRSDVPFGAFLSGGLDSSSIVALMSEIADYKIKTFTIGFDDKAFDESKLAKEVADKFNTEHHRGTITPGKFEELLNKTAFHYDEPFGDSSAIPTGYVSMYAADKVKMVLAGDGGDEVLSGYISYTGLKIANIINAFPGFITKSIPPINNAMASQFKGKMRYKLNKVSNVIRTAKLDFPERIADKSSYTDLSNIRKLTANINDRIKIEDYLSDFINTSGYKDDFYKLMYLNFKLDLPNDYLVKVDRMSMASSLETRLPFLDHRLIEYMVKVDKNVKMQGWERKSVLRNSVGKKLPQSILSAPKRGFGVPLREWFKDDSFDSQLANNLNKVSGILDEKVIADILGKNKSGQKDNGNFIWTLMMLNKNI